MDVLTRNVAAHRVTTAYMSAASGCAYCFPDLTRLRPLLPLTFLYFFFLLFLDVGAPLSLARSLPNARPECAAIFLTSACKDGQAV